MTYQFDGYNYLLRLQRGESLINALNTFAREAKLKSAWCQGIGGAESATIGYYDLANRNYLWHDINELVEITSLSGNLAWVDDEPFWHLHGVFGDKNFQSLSGHIKNLTVGATCEIFVHSSQRKITRALDPEVGLKLLNLGEES